MLISDFCHNTLSFTNELRVLNEMATPETFPTMLNAVLMKHGLDKTLGHLVQG